MQYIKFTFHIQSSDVEQLTEALFEVGCLGIETIDSETLTENHEDHYGEIYTLNRADFPKEGAYVIAYFENMNDLFEQQHQINEVLLNHQIVCLDEIKYGFDDQNYEETWKEHHQEVQITDQISIIPPWMESDRRLAISIEPGLGFGTGNHPTTKMCLQLLSQYIQPNDSVLDLGTGSGVIAILASKLTQNQVYGIDLDEVALKNACHNASLNHSERIHFSQDLNVIVTPLDLIVANIVVDVIIELLPTIYSSLKEDGICILSGVQEINDEKLKHTINSTHFTMIEQKMDKGFIAYVLKKR